jgi:hypothetical protein
MHMPLLLGQRGEQKKLQKAATKAPNPILNEIRGFTYTNIQKAVFRLSKTRFFRYFFFRRADFCGFSCGASSRKKPGFFS